MKRLVLYHADCADGFCAAWAAWRYFGDKAEYVPVQYGQEPPDVTGCDLYILDFSYKQPVMKRLIESAGEIVVLDHHKTAQAEFVGLEEYARDVGIPHRFVFDMDKSGGRLAWEHFFPGKDAPWLVRWTEDRDLWRWQLIASKEVSAALASYPKDFALWDNFHQQGTIDNYPPPELCREGSAILRYQQQLIDGICRSAVEIDLDGHKVLSTNATVLISEVGQQLSKGRPFSATYFVRGDDERKVWSLRSQTDGLDVSEIAKRHGGGGHKNAAGFVE